MSRFTAPLVVTPLNNGRQWRILSTSESDYGRFPFGYDIGEEGSGISIVPPGGFVTDFASIPRWLWWLLPRWGVYGNAAVIHDYLYRGGKITMVKFTNQPVSEIARFAGNDVGPRSRKEADDIMLEAMEVLNTPKWQQKLIYRGVRMGGARAWKKGHKHG